MTRSIAPGTSISRLQRSGTCPKPSSRAATAGNWAFEVVGGGEDDRDEVLGLDVVSRHQLRDELARSREDRLLVVGVGLRRAPDCPQSLTHRGLNPSRAPRPGEPRAFARPPPGRRSSAMRAEADPLQRDDLVAHRLGHPADLPVAALAQGDLDPALAGAADPRLPRRSVIQLDPVPQPGQLRIGRGLPERRAIGPLDPVAGVREPVRELAVVGQQDQPVESASSLPTG